MPAWSLNAAVLPGAVSGEQPALELRADAGGVARGDPAHVHEQGAGLGAPPLDLGRIGIGIAGDPRELLDPLLELERRTAAERHEDVARLESLRHREPGLVVVVVAEHLVLGDVVGPARQHALDTPVGATLERADLPAVEKLGLLVEPAVDRVEVEQIGGDQLVGCLASHVRRVGVDAVGQRHPVAQVRVELLPRHRAVLDPDHQLVGLRVGFRRPILDTVPLAQAGQQLLPLGLVATVHDRVDDLPLDGLEGLHLGRPPLADDHDVRALSGVNDTRPVGREPVDRLLEVGVHATPVDRTDRPVTARAVGLRVLCDQLRERSARREPVEDVPAPVWPAPRGRGGRPAGRRAGT